MVDSLLHPRGPEPPGVYWRRRLTVLVFFVIVVVLLVLIARSGGGKPSGSGTAAPPGSAHPTTTGSASPSGSGSAAPSPTGSAGSPSAATSGSAAPPVSPGATTSTAPCATGTITLTPIASSQSYPPGTQPRLTAHLQNTGPSDCRLTMAILVTSGNARIFSSADCPQSYQQSVLVPARASADLAVVWNRFLSAQHCPTGQPAATAGAYVMHVQVNGQTIDGPAFALQ